MTSYENMGRIPGKRVKDLSIASEGGRQTRRGMVVASMMMGYSTDDATEATERQ